MWPFKLKVKKDEYTPEERRIIEKARKIPGSVALPPRDYSISTFPLPEAYDPSKEEKKKKKWYSDDYHYY